MNRLSDDQYILKRSNPALIDIQWPIGTGKIGALVGDVEDEVIPVSIAGLYVTQLANQAKFDDKETRKRSDYFHLAREALKGGF